VKNNFNDEAKKVKRSSIVRNKTQVRLSVFMVILPYISMICPKPQTLTRQQESFALAERTGTNRQNLFVNQIHISLAR